MAELQFEITDLDHDHQVNGNYNGNHNHSSDEDEEMLIEPLIDFLLKEPATHSTPIKNENINK